MAKNIVEVHKGLTLPNEIIDALETADFHEGVDKFLGYIAVEGETVYLGGSHHKVLIGKDEKPKITVYEPNQPHISGGGKPTGSRKKNSSKV